MEFQHAGHQYWLGTFRGEDFAARAYDIIVWRLGLPLDGLSFPEIESLEAAELVGLKVTIVTGPTKPKSKTDNASKESDAEMMARFAREHLDYVQ